MAEVLLFHHALGLTSGCRSFAGELRAAGHVVHTPDLYQGKTFSTLEEGIAHVKGAGFDTIMQRGRQAAEGLPSELVYAGISLGVMPAQFLAQTRSRAKGAVLISAAIPASEFGGSWPGGVPLQIHLMEDDPLVRDEGDLDAARELMATVEGAELYLYRGAEHLFVDDSVSDYDEAAAALLKERLLASLGRVG
jgi:dienelactone hydrolase